jgi:hypothetical protein
MRARTICFLVALWLSGPAIAQTSDGPTLALPRAGAYETLTQPSEVVGRSQPSDAGRADKTEQAKSRKWRLHGLGLRYEGKIWTFESGYRPGVSNDLGAGSPRGAFIGLRRDLNPR